MPPPRMVAEGPSPHCDLARWVLERLGIPYREDRHVPVLHLFALWRAGGRQEVPVLVTAETTLLDTPSIIRYYDARVRREDRLFPEDGAARQDAGRLFSLFNVTLSHSARRWAYSYLLPLRSLTRRSWGAGTPWTERVLLALLYPLLAALVRRSLGISEGSAERDLAAVKGIFDEVDGRLADGRRYLVGDRLSAADLAFATLAAPVLLPDHYGGTLPAPDECPNEMRAVVSVFRQRKAGQFALRLYDEQRPRSSTRIVEQKGFRAWAKAFKARLLAVLTAPRVERGVFWFLRKFKPILVLGKKVIVARHDDVVEVLKRDEDFTVAPVNAPRTNRDNGRFVLAMDRSPLHEREKALLEQVTRRDDLGRIREIAASAAAELVEAAWPLGRIDVSGGLARIVPARLVAGYFGVPGPNEGTLMRWMRALFYDIFLNLGDDPDVREAGVRCGLEWRIYMEAFLAKQKAEGGAAASGCLPERNAPGGCGRGDTVLDRMLALQGKSHPWLDDDAIIRNLSGMIIGTVDTTNKVVAQALDELLKRPDALKKCSAAAVAGDMQGVGRYAFEALRFNPNNPILVRYCHKSTVLGSSNGGSADIGPQGGGNGVRNGRPRAIPRNTTVFAATLSAMFDPAVFSRPAEFRVDRGVDYLHFGYGLHACQGRYISGVQVPELVAAVTRLKNLRRAPGASGRLAYDGPFPDNLVLEFDPS